MEFKLNYIEKIRREFFGTTLNEEDLQIEKALFIGASAIYQIERAIAQLKAAAEAETLGQTAGIMISTLTQLEMFLEAIIEKSPEPDSTPQQDAGVPGKNQHPTSESC